MARSLCLLDSYFTSGRLRVQADKHNTYRACLYRVRIAKLICCGFSVLIDDVPVERSPSLFISLQTSHSGHYRACIDHKLMSTHKKLSPSEDGTTDQENSLLFLLNPLDDFVSMLCQCIAWCGGTGYTI